MTSEALVVAAFNALTELEVPFMVSGSLASNFYGVPRATQDADVVLDLDSLPVDALAARLMGTFDLDRQIGFESVTASPRLIARAHESPFEIELFGLTDDPHDVERFARRRPVEILGCAVALPTVEDVIINKLRWFAIARRRKDFEDARNVIAVQRASIDWPDVERWCRALDLETVLEAART